MDHEGGMGRYLHFSFPFTLCIGEAGPAQDTTVFGVSFSFPYLHLHHRRKALSAPEEYERSRCGLLFTLHMHRGVVLLGRWDRDTNFIPPLLVEDVQTLSLCHVFVCVVMRDKSLYYRRASHGRVPQ